MYKKVLVFGCGQIGNAVAQRIVKIGHQIMVADKVRWGWDTWIQCDFSQELNIPNIEDYDLAINCAPSKYGYKIAKYVLSKGVSCVDISFYERDPFTLNELAIETGATYIPDAGFAPGLTNLLVGRKLYQNQSKLQNIEINVGGVSKSPLDLYGYAVTWSLNDLMEEYKRPARIIANHEVITCLAGNELTDVEVGETGILMEGLITDGLRTLLRYNKIIQNVVEYTLRWPGHYEKFLPMIRKGQEEQIIELLRKNCTDIKDTILLDCFFDYDHIYMIRHANSIESAMQIATAGTCAAICEAVLEEKFLVPGVHPPEELGRRLDICDSILRTLQEREGIILQGSM